MRFATIYHHEGAGKIPSPIKIEYAGCAPEDPAKTARTYKRGGEARRFLAIAMILRGATRQEAAATQGVDRQTIRDWVARFDEAGPDGLRDKPRGESAGRLDDGQIGELVRVLAAGPGPERDGVVRWRLRNLLDWIERSFGVAYSVEGVRRLVRRPGFRHVSPRPFHTRSDPAAQEKFRRESGELAMETAPRGVDPGKVEIWFQDEARAGQKGMLARLWARKGTRPRVVRDYPAATATCSPPPARGAEPRPGTSATGPAPGR